MCPGRSPHDAKPSTPPASICPHNRQSPLGHHACCRPHRHARKAPCRTALAAAGKQQLLSKQKSYKHTQLSKRLRLTRGGGRLLCQRPLRLRHLALQGRHVALQRLHCAAGAAGHSRRSMRRCAGQTGAAGQTAAGATAGARQASAAPARAAHAGRAPRSGPWPGIRQPAAPRATPRAALAACAKPLLHGRRRPHPTRLPCAALP